MKRIIALSLVLAMVLCGCGKETEPSAMEAPVLSGAVADRIPAEDAAVQETEAPTTVPTTAPTVPETTEAPAAEPTAPAETTPSAPTEAASVPTQVPSVPAENVTEPVEEEQGLTLNGTIIGTILVAGCLTFFLIGALIFRAVNRKGGRYSK